MGRAVCLRPGCHHGGDQRLHRLRPASLPPGHRRVQGPCRDAGQARHHCGGRCEIDRSRSRHDPVRDRGGQILVPARARGHPHERGGAAGRHDRRRRPGGCTPRARATTRWRPISSSGCATPSTRSTRRSPALQKALAEKALAHAGTVMPGFTHLQTAQPVTFGHHLLAYVEMAARDRGRFADARKRLNECPLGSGALAGTSFPLDRDMTAKALGFDRPDRQFARRRLRPRLRDGDACRRLDRGGASVAARRGDRDLDLAFGRPGQALRQVHHRLLDDAAEAQPGRGRTGARQDRPHHRRAHRHARS